MNLYLRGACNAPIEFFGLIFMCKETSEAYDEHDIEPFFIEIRREVTAKDMHIQREIVFL